MKTFIFIDSANIIYGAKANCDVDLTLDTLTESKNYDNAVFLSGDGDFLTLYTYLESIGKSIKIISESKMTAKVVRRHFQEKFTNLLSIKHIIQKTK